MNVPEVSTLAQTSSQWETFYAPFSFRCVQPTSLSVSGRATMVRDQYIYLSMRMMGFEVATVYVDRDSAFVADKYHKVYMAEPISSLTARTGITIGDIQDILMGRAFYPGKGTLCLVEEVQAYFSPMEQEDGIVLMPRRIPAGTSWFFTIDDSPELRRLTVEPDGLSPFMAEYGVAIIGDAGSVASSITIAGEVGDRPIEAMCQWNLEKAKWNEPVNEPSLSFRGYRRLSAAELMGALKE